MEKGSSSTVFDSIGYLAGSGNSNTMVEYNFADPGYPTDAAYYRLKITANDGSFEYSSVVEIYFTPPMESQLEQNYPNPFDGSTTFEYTLRKPSVVTFDVCDFNNKFVLPGIWSDTTLFGTYQKVFDFTKVLPSTGYKLVMNVKENDGTLLTFEKSFIWTYHFIDSSLYITVPNAVSQNGAFGILYSDMPLGKEYVWTTPDSPAPVGIIKVVNNLRLLFYKPGFKTLVKEIVIDPEAGQSLELLLENE